MEANDPKDKTGVSESKRPWPVKVRQAAHLLAQGLTQRESARRLKIGETKLSRWCTVGLSAFTPDEFWAEVKRLSDMYSARTGPRLRKVYEEALDADLIRDLPPDVWLDLTDRLLGTSPSGQGVPQGNLKAEVKVEFSPETKASAEKDMRDKALREQYGEGHAE